MSTLVSLIDNHVVDENPENHILAKKDTIVRNKIGFSLKNKTLLERFQVVYNETANA